MQVGQHRHVRTALGRDPAILGQMAADGVDQLGPLAHQKIARPEHQTAGLLLLALDRHEPHRRPLRRLADRLGIGRIVLLPLHERLDVGRRVISKNGVQAHES